jgi:hypothetical protein
LYREAVRKAKPRARAWIGRALGRLGVLAAVLYLLVLVALWFLQERLIFHPTPLPADHRFAFGSDVTEVRIEVPGATLSALHLRTPSPKAIVLYLHGNAGNLEMWFSRVGDWRTAGVDLFMIDYRGYGKSTGVVTNEDQLRADARAAWDLVASQYADVPKVIVGRSLGTALAAGLAAQVQPDLTVLISPYRSMTAMADLQFPWIPSAVLRYPLDTERDVAAIEGPVLVLHGIDDELIPIAQGEAVAKAAKRGELVQLEGVGHNDVQESPAYWGALGGALDRLAPGR